MIGGCEDDEFREPPRRLIERCATGELTLVVSTVSFQELEFVPRAVRDVLRPVGADNLEVFTATGEIRDIADHYADVRALAKGMRAHAEHIAAATTAGVNVLARPAFRNIVNLRRNRQYSEVNR